MDEWKKYERSLTNYLLWEWVLESKVVDASLFRSRWMSTRDHAKDIYRRHGGQEKRKEDCDSALILIFAESFKLLTLQRLVVLNIYNLALHQPWSVSQYFYDSYPGVVTRVTSEIHPDIYKDQKISSFVLDFNSHFLKISSPPYP